ncbi:hypothetical protein BC937DRAFT_93406 [Endogone sp. FLAS-F59071]|nr:hypothetical protein BC937DRAFT_93406 [Endogone sp. FLAS-F59071]|eukprot:RUS21180.1 hypothetical protein BC937DRAFT_93406 [Endogone sp. FLAS-F59071]
MAYQMLAAGSNTFLDICRKSTTAQALRGMLAYWPSFSNRSFAIDIKIKKTVHTKYVSDVGANYHAIWNSCGRSPVPLHLPLPLKQPGSVAVATTQRPSENGRPHAFDYARGWLRSDRGMLNRRWAMTIRISGAPNCRRPLSGRPECVTSPERLNLVMMSTVVVSAAFPEKVDSESISYSAWRRKSTSSRVGFHSRSQLNARVFSMAFRKPGETRYRSISFWRRSPRRYWPPRKSSMRLMIPACPCVALKMASHTLEGINIGKTEVSMNFVTS